VAAGAALAAGAAVGAAVGVEPQAVRIMLAVITTERITYRRFMDFSSKDLYFVE
jgi:hypothetical protein